LGIQSHYYCGSHIDCGDDVSIVSDDDLKKMAETMNKGLNGFKTPWIDLFFSDVPKPVKSKGWWGSGKDRMLYKLSDLERFYKTQYHLGNGHLFVSESGEDCVQFIFVSFFQLDTEDDEIYVRHVFSGYGFSGTLREMRHIHFGELNQDGSPSGYISNFPANAARKAFKKLRKYFDCD